MKNKPILESNNIPDEEHLVFDDDIDLIASRSFTLKTKVKSIVFNGNIKKIDDSAFRNCTSLESVVFKKVDEVCHAAFMRCSKLSNLDFEYIGIAKPNSFRECALSNVDFTKIGSFEEGAFSSNLFYEINLSTHRTIPNSAFADNEKLKFVTIKNASSVDRLAFCHCEIDSCIIDTKYLNLLAFYVCKIDKLYLSNSIKEFYMTDDRIGMNFLEHNIKKIIVPNPAHFVLESLASKTIFKSLLQFSNVEIFDERTKSLDELNEFYKTICKKNYSYKNSDAIGIEI